MFHVHRVFRLQLHTNSFLPLLSDLQLCRALSVADVERASPEA